MENWRGDSCPCADSRAADRTASGYAAKLALGNDRGRGALAIGERRGNAHMSELPDADDGAHNEQAVNDDFKQAAFLGLKKRRVG